VCLKWHPFAFQTHFTFQLNEIFKINSFSLSNIMFTNIYKHGSDVCNDTFQGSHYIFVLKFKDFSRTLKLQFSRTNSQRKFTAWMVLKQHVVSISMIYGTVLADKNKTWQLLANLVLGKTTCLTELLILHSLTWWIQGLSRTCPVFKYFQGLEFGRKKLNDFQVLSRMRGNPDISDAAKWLQN